ncbi:two-component system histidine kinase PnpS [Bacillus sp. FJAT-27251]|uniref:two-component system histidine kinase PnpS n=1 Tax=Bacillus sp. FJAT-27251 TaxID=1684142 RepID=UPI0006A7A644|nr:ATP-binding protein [Bacillus sp. FJAT-27251]
MKNRTQLLFALVTLIIAVLLGLGILLGQLFKTYYLNNFHERLKKEARIITEVIEDDGGLANLNASKMDEMSKILNARFTVMEDGGRIILDTGENAVGASPEWHRGTIAEAIFQREGEGGGAFQKGGVQYYWEAVHYGGELEGHIFLSTEVSEIKQAYSQIWWILTISLGLALAVILMLGIKIASRYTKPIESATNVAIELAKGNYRARTYEDRNGETGMLSASINILARNLQELRKTQEMQQDRLTALIENMGSGLILIDSRGYINLINRPYKELFKADPREHLYRLYHEVIEHQEINDLVEEIFMTEQKTRRQLVLPIGIHRRHFEVYGVPIFGMDNVWKGVLLVFHDITELKKLEQMRKDFVANVSHELKTPITSIKGFSETLLDGAMNDKDALEAFLSIILKESDRLQSLIQDLLELSKIEQHGFRLNITDVNLNSQIADVMAILKGKAEERQVAVEMDAEGEVVIPGDPDRLKQVFINLLNNALNYTPKEGSVTISLSEDEHHAVVKIVDTGIGIEQSEIPRIFERFYRVDKARSRNSGGTGLGLAIVKHIMEAHKGIIEVDSEVGKGTTFTLRLLKKA